MVSGSLGIERRRGVLSIFIYYTFVLESLLNSPAFVEHRASHAYFSIVSNVAPQCGRVVLCVLLSLTHTATSVSGFEVNKVQLTREVNTIVVTLVSTSGLTRDLTLNLG